MIFASNLKGFWVSPIWMFLSNPNIVPLRCSVSDFWKPFSWVMPKGILFYGRHLLTNQDSVGLSAPHKSNLRVVVINNKWLLWGSVDDVAACQWTRAPHLYHISCSYLSNSFLQILGHQSAEPHNSLSSVSHNLLGALIQLVMFSSWSGSPNWTQICCYRLSIIVGVHNSCFRLGKALEEFPPFGAK